MQSLGTRQNSAQTLEVLSRTYARYPGKPFVHQLAPKTLREGYVSYQEDPADRVLYPKRCTEIHHGIMIGIIIRLEQKEGTLQEDMMGETKMIKILSEDQIPGRV